MLSFDWSSLIISSGIINAIISLLILVLNKGNYKISFSIWVGLILTCTTLILMERVIRFSKLEASFPELLFITSPLFFFILPLIYLFQKRLNRMSKYWYLHFIIPFLLTLLLLPTIIMTNSNKLKMYYKEGINDPIWIILLYMFFALYYIRKTLIENKRHKKHLLNEYATNDIDLQVFSNKLVLLSSLLMITIPLSLSVQYLDLNNKILNKFLFIVLSIIPHFILISILTHKNTFNSNTISNEEKSTTDTPITNLKIFKSELTDFMIKEKPYINESLNLQSLADSIGWSRSNLSIIINKGFNKNFYDFVNEYRLNLVIEKLHKGEFKDYSLDYIVNKSGFKNYTSFYRIFKRNKQESPNAYINRLKREDN